MNTAVPVQLLTDPETELFCFQGKKCDYALVVGVYNEGEKILRQLDLLQPYRAYVDVLLADGGSVDGATDNANISDKVSVLLINRDRQRGLSVQYRAALRYAMLQGYKGIIMMDGNGKDGVDAIPRFVEKLQEGYDFLQGSRFIKGGYHENTPIDRVLGIRFVFNPLMWLGSGFLYTDAMNGFKGCSARFLSDTRVQPFREVFVRYNLQYYFNYIAPKIHCKMMEIPVSRVYIKEITHSKIVGIIPRLKILMELFNTIIGKYNP